MRLEFGSEILPPGTIGRQMASTILRSYLGWALVLSLFFLLVRLSEWLAGFKNFPDASTSLKDIGSLCSEDGIEQKSTANLSNSGSGKAGQMNYPVQSPRILENSSGVGFDVGNRYRDQGGRECLQPADLGKASDCS